MKIAMLYPVDKRCGISQYGELYSDALNESIIVDRIDIDSALSAPMKTVSKLKKYDLIDIQYETSIFVKKVASYKTLLKSILIPKVTTVHEIYKKIPGVFPREMIRGNELIKSVRKKIYDWRHPNFYCYRKALDNHFYSDKIICHYSWQKEILVNDGIVPDFCVVIPPIITKNIVTPISFNKQLIRFGASGFINPNFNYKLLFRLLDKLTFNWTFTWIGGVRQRRHLVLLRWIKNEINIRGWEKKFVITGWVDNNIFQRQIAQIDIFLALFYTKSMSSTILNAIGSQRFIISLSMSLTEELLEYGQLLTIATPVVDDLIVKINNIINDSHLRRCGVEAMKAYCNQCDKASIASRLISTYSELIR